VRHQQLWNARDIAAPIFNVPAGVHLGQHGRETQNHKESIAFFAELSNGTASPFR
jgi:hypothetical protein